MHYFERLANVFEVPPDHLREEWAQVLPVAALMKREAGLTNQEAWRRAILGFPKSAATLPALRRVFESYTACQGCTTSGVEQDFSGIAANIPPRRDHMLECRENDEHLIRTVGKDLDADQLAELLQKSQQVWRDIYGATRMRLKRRWDFGTSRMRNFDKKTIDNFVAKRRREVDEALAGGVETTAKHLRRRGA
jgi:hypothetical protein